MAGGKGDGKNVLNRLREDVKTAQKGVEMRASMLEEIFTSLQSCQWRDALNVSYLRPNSSTTVSCTFEKCRFIVDQICVEILVDYSDDNDCILSVSTNPPSTSKWFMLDENEKPSQVLSRTKTNRFRLIVSFPRSILFSSDHLTTVVIHLSQLEKNHSEVERRQSAFIQLPPKDSLIVPIDISAAEELSLESLKSLSHLDHSQFQQLLYSLRLVYCSMTLPSIDVFNFQSRMGSCFEENECGGHPMFIGSGLFSNILITTQREGIGLTVVLHTVFARNNEELQRVVRWIIKLCNST